MRATAPVPAAVPTPPTAAALSGVVATPSSNPIAAQIVAKEAELDAANAAKDRKLAATLLGELGLLEYGNFDIFPFWGTSPSVPNRAACRAPTTFS